MDSTLEVTDYKVEPGSDHITEQKAAAAEAGEAKATGGSSIPGSDAGGHIVDLAPAVSEPGLFYESRHLENLQSPSNTMNDNGHMTNEDVAEGKHPADPTWVRFTHQKEELRSAATEGNWDAAQKICSQHPLLAGMRLDDRGNTALHIAVKYDRKAFLNELLLYLTPEDIEIQDADGNTAFCVAAISGNVAIAQLLLRKNESLPFIRGQHGELPIELAHSSGRREMVKYMFGKMSCWNIPQDRKEPVFFVAMFNKLYTEAAALLDSDFKFSASRCKEGLQEIARQPPREIKLQSKYDELLRQIFKLVAAEGVLLGDAVFDAVKSGDIIFLRLAFEHFPDLISEVNLNGQTLYHIAISCKKKGVFKLLLTKGTSKDLLMESVDDGGNNILHWAAQIPTNEEIFRSSSKPEIQMLLEEQWFKEMQETVPSVLKNMKNKENLTPEDLFYLKHRELSKEAKSAMKATAENCMVVATLVASIAFAAVITVPSKDTPTETETLIFQRNAWYVIFILSNAVALFSSLTSVVLYLSILSSNFPENVLIHSLQKRLSFGLAAIFFSVVSMVVAFTAACFLIFDHLSTWVAYVVTSLGFIPVFTFLASQYSVRNILSKGFSKGLPVWYLLKEKLLHFSSRR